MSELNITSSAEKYLNELLENQDVDTIGIKRENKGERSRINDKGKSKMSR